MAFPGFTRRTLLTMPLVAVGSRPNIVFVIVDDLRWDELGCTGHPFASTPNVDRLAREGARFLNAFATTPLCSPSRANFLTGQYTHTHGIIDNTDRSPRSHQLVTWPRLLHDAGYETAYIGKWHMGVDDSRRPGFDHWVSFPGQGSNIDTVINENGKRRKTKGHVTDVLTDRATAFLKRPHSKPFCLYLAHKVVHPNIVQHRDGSVTGRGDKPEDFAPATRHKTLYTGERIPRRPSAFRPPEDKPALLRKIANLPPLGRATATSDGVIRNRMRMMKAVDEGVGRMLQMLEKSGQLDNTLFILTSDHGYFYGEHGLNYERRLAYEETIRIPMIMRYPRLIRPGTAPEQLVLSIDVAPTMLELGGARNPGDLQGRSLIPLLKGKPGEWRDAFLIEYYSDTVFRRVYKMGYQALRTERWKYIHYKELEGMDELYDLREDPYEMRNLISEPSAGQVLKAIEQRLQQLLRETGG